MHAQINELCHVIVVVVGDTLQGVHTGFFRRHAAPHTLHNGVGSANFYVLLAVACGACSTYFLVAVAASANNR